MPLLGGLFARNSNGSGATSKSKSPSDLSPSASYSHSASISSVQLGSNLSPPPSSQPSPTSEYVSFAPGPSSPNGRSLAYAGEPQKDKRGLGFFGRKRSATPLLAVDTGEPFEAPPRPAYLGRLSTSSDIPPSSASASTSPNSLRPPQNLYTSSTRSLPPPVTTAGASPYAHQTPSRTRDRDRQYSLSPLAPQISPTRSTASGLTAASGKTSKTGAKSGRKFAFWARGKDKEVEPLPPSPAKPSDFNLRAFRHVREEPAGKNQLTATNLTSLSQQIEREGQASGLGSAYEHEHLPPARPRPRGGSDASASSSRISVAAFREVQARRSAAGSPVLGESSARAPSPGPYGRQPQSTQRPTPTPVQKPAKKTSSPPVPSPTTKPQPYTTVHQRAPNAQGNQWDSDEDEDESSPGDSSDDQRKPRPSRQQQQQQRGLGTARSQSSLGVYGQSGSTEKKMGGSTGNLVASASGGNVASKRLSLTQEPTAQRKTCGDKHLLRPPSLLPAKPAPPPKATSVPNPSPHTRRPTNPDDSDSDESTSEESSDDDAPLATLVAPRRPGSSLSMASNGSNPNLKPKPLIDINEVTGSRPVLAGQKKTDDGFTGAGMLAVSSKASSSSQLPSPVLTSRSPPPPSSGRGGFVQFPSPPGSPVRETPPPVTVKAAAAPRRSPIRKETGGSVASVSLGGQDKREGLVDRLKAVSATSASGSTSQSSLASTSTRPTLAPPNAGSPPSSFSSVTARKAFHRRSSSDIVSASGRSPTWLDDAGSKSGEADDGALGRDLADMLGGGGLAFLLGEEAAPLTQSVKNAAEKDKEHEGNIVPIVIKQRSPLPGFSVTSRPANRSVDLGSASTTGGRQRSSTLIPSTSTSAASSTANSTSTSTSSSSTNALPKSAAAPSGNARQRSSTLMTTPATTSNLRSAPAPATFTSFPRQTPSQPIPSSRSSPPIIAQPTPSPSPPSLLGRPPQRPFAGNGGVRGNSPASSTGTNDTGNSSRSSGALGPLTPRDGSEVGSAMSSGNSGSGSAPYAARGTRTSQREEKVRDDWSGGASGLLPAHVQKAKQRRSVSFDFDESRVFVLNDEERRRERRRSEAKAAIELGNIVNGPGPVPDDDEEDDLPINQIRNANPMMQQMQMPMGMGMQMPMGGWPQMQMPRQMPMQMPMQMQMQMQVPMMPNAGQFMMPPPSDPSMMAAHQQAMLYAKQAYQMAVAQQAMAAAGEEWERGSTMTGMRGSVYAGSQIGGAGGGGGGLSPFGMGLAMLNAQNGQGQMFPSGARSLMGGGARSDYGGMGGGGGGNWNSSRSVYGEAFGPSTERYQQTPTSSRSMSSGNLAGMAKTPGQSPAGAGQESGYFAGALPASNSRPGLSAARQRTASSPSKPGGAVGGQRRGGPPSSWRAGM
ncbi:hypothetical protein MIND_01252000 [Mycena indigotica]|uniref:Uncharacterized protein n=1 Tax=Mycena indigotica TaxID=2126181 RepID=A0A8H6VUB6_9AGAR|nr:uncharacterized protein MIND_01252000 [Mycena indigotica]KAF7292246.1 hypothetical protein MIND_01252000 [Mycena indigotica]